MAKTAKKKVNKKKLMLWMGLSLGVILVASIAWINFKPPAPMEMDHAVVAVGSITETLETSGRVIGENQGAFQVLNGIKVIDVHVGVGQRIVAGQLLATFDEGILNSELAEKQQAYDLAVKTVNDAKKSAKDAQKQLTANTKRLAQIDKDIAELTRAAEAAARQREETTTTAPQPASTGLPDGLLGTIRSLLQGDISQITQGISSVTSLLGGGSALGFDMSEMYAAMGAGMGGMTSGTTALEMEKMQLQLQQTLLEAQTGDTLTSVYQSIADNAKTALEQTRAVVELARGGWVAEYDGLVREVNITAGEVFLNAENASAPTPDIGTLLALIQGDGTAAMGDLLGSLWGGTGHTHGMLIEYFPFTAELILNHDNALKVRLGQPAQITTRLNNVINGTLSFINPVAESSSGMDISSILGNSGGAESGIGVKVSIPHPDESVIIGMDVNISLELNSVDDAVVIPLVAVQRNETGNFVWVYDSANQIALQRHVELGILDRTNRQVLSGLAEGERVLLPKTQMEIADLNGGRKVTLK